MLITSLDLVWRTSVWNLRLKRSVRRKASLHWQVRKGHSLSSLQPHWCQDHGRASGHSPYQTAGQRRTRGTRQKLLSSKGAGTEKRCTDRSQSPKEKVVNHPPLMSCFAKVQGWNHTFVPWQLSTAHSSANTAPQVHSLGLTWNDHFSLVNFSRSLNKVFFLRKMYARLFRVKYMGGRGLGYNL